MRHLLTCITALLLLLTACSPEGEGGLEGQLLFQDRPLAAAQVEVYLKAEKDRSVQPFAVSSTDAEGRYRVNLPEGSYFVIGKKRESTDDGRSRVLMEESPANPHRVANAFIAVPSFNLREMGREGLPAAAADTGLAGQVTSAGAPAARAYVYIYTGDSGLVGPSYGEAVQTDAEGHFLVNLPPGNYALVARKRAAGGRSGELEPGDLNAVYPRNPVTVSAGAITRLGPFPLEGIDAERNAQRRAEGIFDRTDTALTGRVIDADGEPVDGVYVFAYLDSRMVGKPVHLSAPSGEDGSFALFLGDGGTYYVGARSAYGGPLEPGEWVGTFEGRPDHGCQVERGASVDIGAITVREVW